MKKLSIFLAGAALALGFTACDSERDTVLNLEDLKMEIAEPTFAHELLALDPEGENLVIEATQPNYGFSAATTYSLQVALTEAFKDFETVTPTNPGYAKMEIAQNDLAIALNELYGFDANTYVDQGEIPVYVRAAAEIEGVEGTLVTSDVVKLDKVTFPYAAKGPGQIYLVGNPSGWTQPSLTNLEHYEAFVLTETGAGTGIFTGAFEFKPGDYFRFYKTLGLTGTPDDWGKDNELPSLGPVGTDGQNVEVVFENGVFQGDVVPGKGSWFMSSTFAPGSVLLTVDLNKMAVTFEQGAVDYSKFKCIYLVGTPSGWTRPSVGNAEKYANFKLYDLAGNGVYVTVEPVVFGKDSYWRFYQSLGETDTDADWAADGELPSMGPNAKDGENTEVTFTDGTFEGTMVAGKGSWFVKEPYVVNMSVDVTNMKVTFTEVEAAIPDEPAE